MYDCCGLLQSFGLKRRNSKGSVAGLGLYKSILRPLMFSLDTEAAHSLALFGLKLGLVPSSAEPQDDILKQSLWGFDFPNPIGLAAGFDKNAEVFEQLLQLGFGFVETGTVTPLAQPGNEKPRMFRLVEDDAIINRLGFNNDGLAAYQVRLEKWRYKGARGIVGANIGKNKTSTNSVGDYVKGVSALSELASYLVVNVSSPNTPGLRDLQGKQKLSELLQSVLEARSVASRQPPLFLKVAPDLESNDIEDIAEVATTNGIGGIIATNTTIDRPDFLTSKNKAELGGLSGKPLFAPSCEVLKRFYKMTNGDLPLIGVGGVSDGRDAYEKIKSGASLVQFYSSMIFEGPWVAKKINHELADLLRNDGFKNVADAIGASV